MQPHYYRPFAFRQLPDFALMILLLRFAENDFQSDGAVTRTLATCRSGVVNFFSPRCVSVPASHPPWEQGRDF